MTVLPSPIPHPLDFCPWQLPGWVYEALDWVVGVEWPEGDEKAVWDLADQWYAVATTLAGPRADAITAAGEVRSGYGAVGAVAEAFDTAWKKVADGDEAPLPLLLAVSTDLGRLVEECGCDIEGAKLEVWIELGILVVELLSMAIAVVLTAGAASPAAAAAITATRFIVQQIFKKLIAQLARKTLKKGMQEATERAAKQVTRDGLRGLGRNALRGGLQEAAEEGGVNLAIQGYQNSTGRRDGVDLADLGASAVGGFAGGAAAPLAGLGRKATSRGGRIAENFGREMGGEVIAEQAASLATGGGFTGLEDAARAAASGATGSAVSQSDAALQARLDGRLAALAGTTQDQSPMPPATVGSTPAPPSTAADPTSPIVPSQQNNAEPRGADGGPSTPLPRTVGMDDSPGPASLESRGTTSGSLEAPEAADRRTDTLSRPVSADPVTAAAQTGSPPSATPSAGPAPAMPTLSALTTEPLLAGSPVATSMPVDPSPTTSTTPPTASPVAPGPAPIVAAGPSPSVTPGPAPTVTTTPAMTGVPTTPMTIPTAAVAPNPALTAGATSTMPNTTPTTGTPSQSLPGQHGGTERAVRTTPARPDTTPVNDLSLLEVLAPKTSQSRANPEPAPAPGPTPQPPKDPAPRTPEWYEASWAEDREALERRRYQGYFNSQRAWFEDRRREEEVGRLRALAEEHMLKAREYAKQAIRLGREGKRDLTKRWHEAAVNEERACYRYRDLAEEVRDGRIVPDVTMVEDDVHFRRINDDVAELAVGGVETDARSALTGDDGPPSSDQTRPYGQWGGLRPPLALHQTDLERQMPREPDGSVTRTADPRQGRWFSLVNDGGPSADATRAINCLDCTLSMYETWLHGRPRVSAPRTFDGYLGGDVNRPINGEAGGPGRVESVTGGAYQRVVSTHGRTPAGARQQVLQGYADLRGQLLSGGHGTFAFLVNTWEGGGAHAWVALNQNGTVLYLDPQVGTVSDRPPYVHRGVPSAANVTSLEALVVGPGGKPMPMPGRELGDFSTRWPNPDGAGPGGGPVNPNLDPGPQTDVDGSRSGDQQTREAPSGTEPGHEVPGETADDGLPPQSDPDAASFLTPDEWRSLTLLRERAENVADEVEGSLAEVGRRVTQALEAERPVELRDREHRLKSIESLARKFHDEAVVVGVSVQEFAGDVNDVLRFSFAMPGGALYTQAVNLLLAELTGVGFSVEDADCKNFWRPGNRFYGFNCTLRSPQGQLFELQLHTDDSRNAWLETHVAYETLRRGDQTAPDRVHAFMEMLSINRAFAMAQAVPPGLSDRFPEKDATFAKWISANYAVWLTYKRWLSEDGRAFADVVVEHGLTRQDFPISEKTATGLEQVDVDLLHNLPDRRPG